MLVEPELTVRVLEQNGTVSALPPSEAIDYAGRFFDLDFLLGQIELEKKR